jgi:hypothetical protein
MKRVDDSSQSFKYPPNLTIVGLGGCGKKLAREICNHDWLLHYYSSDVNRLKIYTMDTDANESAEDQRWETKIMEKVDNLEGAGNIEFKSYYLPNLANITHVSDLTSAAVSASIKRSQSIKTWWLNDPENNGVTFQDLKRIDHFIMDDFGGGVHRRRAVSKAILYKVLSEGQANGFPTFSNPGVTAIIVGIGGGTGSGMFIDLARYIKEKRDDAVYLFAVLPTTKEGEKEQLNAAISLTELEYLNVSHDERLFDHVIFTSLGPTEYTNGQYELEEVDEFDSVFPQILTNFFHIERSDLNLSDARKSYSSFIFADSHVIEYPVEELRELKEQYSQIIHELEEIDAVRKDVNEIIESLLIKFNISGESTPTMEVFEFIKTEYRNIEKVWTNNIAKLLNYHSVEQIEEFIKYNVSEIQFDKIGTYNDLISYISRVNNFAQGVAQDKLKDEIDKKLFRLIPEALDTLRKNAILFKWVAAVENEDCRSVMINILKGKRDISPLLGALNIKNQEIQTLNTKLKPTEQKMAELNSLPIEIDKKIKDKLNDIDLDLESYAKINRNIKYLPDNEQKLKETLDWYIDKLSTGKVRGNDKNSWFLSAGTKDVRMEIEAISKDNEYDLESLSRFIDSVTNYYYYKNKIKEVEKGGLRALILGKRKQLIKKYNEHAGKEEDYIKSNVKYWAIRIDTPFNIVIPENFLTIDLIKKVEVLRERICNSVFADLNINNIDSDKLDRIFASDDRVKIRQFLREDLKELHLKAANYFTSMEDLNRYIKDINEEIEEKQLQYDMLIEVDAANTETFSSRKNFNLHYEYFHEHFEIINKKIEAGKRTKKGIYKTKFGSVNPQILSLVEGRSDTNANPDMGNLDMDKNGKLELDKLINLAKSTYQDLFESRKLGVNSLKISIGDTERWTFGKAALVVSSTSGYVRSELMKSMISVDINQSLSLKKPNDSLLTPHGHTKPWEIALTFFAASSFLDNIYPLVAGGGYWEIYARNKENILHHVLKLQDGEYITRNALLSSEAAGKIANNERIEEIPQEIKSLYKTKSLKEALKLENQ